ncbi:unnamed protein product [Meganyctiphanes norvegica]|uniref:Chitin-binding type-2 domain-containing protein n=1 Tax=Meganyctiphanes norvegica TaxID=48144 RepID=A0AAV2QSR3_MEGNR
MATLASVAVLLLVSVSVEPQLTAACFDNTLQCSGCTSLFVCYDGTEYQKPCASGQVCGNNGTSSMVDGCFDVSDSSNIQLSYCACDGSSASASYMDDVLSTDPAAYLACLPGQLAPQSVLCPDNQFFMEGNIPPCGSANTTQSATGPSTTMNTHFTCTASGFVADPSVCSKYWLCTSDSDSIPTELKCDDGLVFNEATLSCYDPCDSSVETFSCATDITGTVADSLNCSIFHVCVNGVAVGPPVPCANSGEGFNSESGVCESGYTCEQHICLICSTIKATDRIQYFLQLLQNPLMDIFYNFDL